MPARGNANPTGLRRRHGHHNKGSLRSIQNILFVTLVVLGLIYYRVSVYLLQGGKTAAKGTVHNHRPLDTQYIHELQEQGLLLPSKTLNTYQEWRDYATQLASLTPEKIVKTLKLLDPFGVRTFEAKLLEAESEKKAFLTQEELRSIFPCPTSSTTQQQEQQRITLPDQRNSDKARAFRNGTEPYFLFFQHLRKAGGTNFCSLAQHNLPKKQVPKYYCMPDYYWEAPGRPCAGCFSRFDTKTITKHMKEDGHKILGNEWDAFDPDHYFDLPATFATSFRRPLDRALSQFRFECIEDRGCKIKNVTKWWDKRSKDLTNVYVWTFSNEGVRKLSIGTTKADSERRQKVLGRALDVVARFNLVMAMEWLAYAPNHVQRVLGFRDTKTLTERVRPHIAQHKRDDGQERNVMGAAGIAKASWTPENYLPPETYTRMSHDLALDEILTDAARRMFLERLVCDDVSMFD
ncbi:hypothetical protein IV203_000966 [Nitzschia inconspicua]|uniref:Uncharacterized protein n=1 Tax=Nitzschia inconspicua TaxID=303405 RepID=A0A9K3L7F5_9STRA|nr:hypothetical protein IV203_000966 [Nitzschia inconspicua]